MQLQNRLGLPAPLVRALTREPRPRVPGRISLTELIQPAQIRALTVRHGAEILEDASDLIWALLGTLLHGALEGYADRLQGEIPEEKLVMEILGWTVVGKYDLSEMVLDGELLTDWKLTSVWSMKDGFKLEWEQQLNCYAQLVRHAGRNVDQIQIVAIGRDWSKNKARFDKDYPQEQVKVIAVPLWTAEETLEFITERVRLHQEAEKGIWPDCTPEERWARPTQWAVMKKGQKKAVKLYESKHAAEWAVAKDQYIVERPGESVRCNAYCAVANVCPQKAKMEAAIEAAKTQAA